MTRRVLLRRSAQTELIDLIDYIADDDPASAERVRDAVFASFQQLADNPHIGRPYPAQNPRLAGLRKWNVHGYPAYLIFYLKQTDGTLDILHITDGRRDIAALLEPE
ncbi:MAG: type II toxin-antitoxin system RelE/ParE family toxin [Phycisphaerales bacterium]